MAPRKNPVLIIGAGPTGLVLALSLVKKGIPTRIVDQTSRPGTTSRALVIHARTLELYRFLGIAKAVISKGVPFTAVNLWVKKERRAHLPIGELGLGVSPYPYMLILPQDLHEAILVQELRKHGVKVERKTTLVSFETRKNEVLAELKLPNGKKEVCRADYLAGCDGARSTVRKGLDLNFEGGTYPDLYYVADLLASGPLVNQELHVALDESDFFAIFPMKGKNNVRLVGQIRQTDVQKDTYQWKDVSPRLDNRLDLDVKNVVWFSTYHVHHRVAPHFQKDRVFLLGDAAHVHSPVGGQGMNTGIGDAINLAWRLEAVLKKNAVESLLDSYEIERRAFALTLVATTDRAFRFVSSHGPIARVIRTRVIPTVMPFLLRSRAFQLLFFKTVSQTELHYKSSPLNQGGGKLSEGNRLPWVEFGSTRQGKDNYTVLETREWQMHVYGRLDLGREKALRMLRIQSPTKKNSTPISLHVFHWEEKMAALGLEADALYVIRPDGYVGAVISSPDSSAVQEYFKKIGVVIKAK